MSSLINLRKKVLALGEGDIGQTAVILVLGFTVLAGCLGLAIDTGLFFVAKRNVQIAADAAAVAGALDYKYNATVSTAQSTGQAAATANGVTNGTNGASVTINVPPANGPYAGTTGFVEAIVSEPASTYFFKMLKLGSVTVSARAVAGSGNVSGCVWALAKSGTDVSVTGSGSFSASNCTLYDDSSSSNALTLTGSGSISAKNIAIVGSYKDTGSGSIHPNPPTTGIAPAADPLANIPTPTVSTGTCSSNCTKSFSGSSNNSIGPGTYNSISNTGSGTLTLTPGNYIINGNLSNTGSGNLVLGAGNYTITGSFTTSGSGALTLGAGNYTVQGNLSLTGSGALTGIGVTFFTQGSTAVTGSGSMDLEAPTSGTYDGVMFFQDRSDTQTMSLTGSGGATFKGIVYAAAAPVTLTGSGSWNIDADFITDSITLTGSGSISDTSYQSINASSVLSRMAMVE
jgi:Flp pilus assembly protein TadG